MSTHHPLHRESDDGHDILLVCREDGCGRKVVVRRPSELIVIDRGDFSALHRYANEPMDMATSVA